MTLNIPVSGMLNTSMINQIMLNSHNLDTATFVQQVLSGQYDTFSRGTHQDLYGIQVNRSLEGLFEVLVKSSINGAYDLFFKESLSGTYSIISVSLVRRLLEAPCDIQVKHSSDSSWDHLLKKPLESLNDIYLTTSKEDIYGINLSSTIFEIHKILLKASTVSSFDQLINTQVSSTQDIQAKSPLSSLSDLLISYHHHDNGQVCVLSTQGSTHDIFIEDNLKDIYAIIEEFRVFSSPSDEAYIVVVLTNDGIVSGINSDEKLETTLEDL